MTTLKLSPKGRTSVVPDLLGRDLSNAVVFFHEAVASRIGLNSAEWKCLGLLDQQGTLTAGQLAERSGFTTGAITGIVGRLERKGYVRREPNPRDARSVILHPARLDEIRERIAPVFESLGRSMGAVASRFNAGELKAIGRYVRDATEALRVETDRIRFSGPE